MDPEKQQRSLDFSRSNGDNRQSRKSDEFSITEHPGRHAEGPRAARMNEADDMEKEETDVESAQSENHSPKAPDKDPNLVDWDGPDDPENPQNWSLRKKWVVTMSLAWMTLWITFSSSVFASATVATSKEFHVSTEVMTLGTSLMVLGYMVGPLIWSPSSELLGRRIPLFFGYTVFAIFQVPVAVAQNVQTIMLCRFLGGVFGCSPLAVIGGTLADFWDPVHRAVAVALFAAATFLGPVMGPIIGGFLTSSSLGWRWTAWITLIASSFFGLIAFVIVPETYAPVLLQRKATRLRKETRNWALHSMLDEHQPTMSEIFFKYFLRPFEMLFLEPILLLITIYMAFIYGVLYLFFEAYPVAFLKVRGWKHPGVAALPFIGILVGVLCGVAFIIFVTKTRFARKMEKHGRVDPEERLLPMIPASIALPAGLFWFGWSAHTSWVAQAIAGVPTGFGILVIFMQGLNYIIDVYMMFANSAIAANTLMRSALGGAFPLFAVQMYDKLGVDWASSLLGFITVAMIPIPILFFFYGKKIRAMSKFTPKF